MESNFLFWSDLKISPILNFTQPLVPLFRMSEFLFRMRNRLIPPPYPGPLFHFSRHPFPLLQLQLLCQPGSLNPLPHNPFPQVKINKMSVSWLLFGLHLTSFFLFWAFRFLSGNYKPCLDSRVGVISSFLAPVPFPYPHSFLPQFDSLISLIGLSH